MAKGDMGAYWSIQYAYQGNRGVKSASISIHELSTTLFRECRIREYLQQSLHKDIVITRYTRVSKNEFHKFWAKRRRTLRLSSKLNKGTVAERQTKIHDLAQIS